MVPILEHQHLPLRAPRADLTALNRKKALSESRFLWGPPPGSSSSVSLAAGQVLCAPRRRRRGKGERGRCAVPQHCVEVGEGGDGLHQLDSSPGMPLFLHPQ